MVQPFAITAPLFPEEDSAAAFFLTLFEAECAGCYLRLTDCPALPAGIELPSSFAFNLLCAIVGVLGKTESFIDLFLTDHFSGIISIHNKVITL